MNAYLVVFPKAIQGYDANTENIKNLHVFDIAFSPINNWWYLARNCSHCNNGISISKTYLIKGCFFNIANINKYYIKIDTLSDLRIYLADCQNNGIEVCGQCVVTLYTDGQ